MRHPLQVKQVVLVNIHSWLSPPRSLDQDLNISSFRRTCFGKPLFVWPDGPSHFTGVFFLLFFVKQRFTLVHHGKMWENGMCFQVEMLFIGGSIWGSIRRTLKVVKFLSYVYPKSDGVKTPEGLPILPQVYTTSIWQLTSVLAGASQVDVPINSNIGGADWQCGGWVSLKAKTYEDHVRNGYFSRFPIIDSR